MRPRQRVHLGKETLEEYEAEALQLLSKVQKKNGNNQRGNAFFFSVFLSSVLKVKTKKLMVL